MFETQSKHQGLLGKGGAGKTSLHQRGGARGKSTNLEAGGSESENRCRTAISSRRKRKLWIPGRGDGGRSIAINGLVPVRCSEEGPARIVYTARSKSARTL